MKPAIAKEVADMLLGIEAVKISIDPPFTWVSGLIAPIYCDNRLLISYPKEREKIVSRFVSLIEERNLQPDVIAGTATAGIPWAAFVAHAMKLPMIYIRPEPKGHGAGKQIEGRMKEGQKVVIIEDLISTGGSSIKSAEAVRNEGGGEVTDVLAIMNYGLAAAEKNFAEAGFHLETLTHFDYLIGNAMEQGYLSEEDKEKVMAFKEDPKSWAERVGIA